MYSEPCQISKMEHFAKTARVGYWSPPSKVQPNNFLTGTEKSMIIPIWLIGYNYIKSTFIPSILSSLKIRKNRNITNMKKTSLWFIYLYIWHWYKRHSKLVYSNIYMKTSWIKTSQKLDQTGLGSGLLVSVSLLDAQRNSTKRPSYFYPLKTPVS